MTGLVLVGASPAGVSAQYPATGAPYHEADVRFMQDMIVHHAQAVILSRMVADRTDRRELGLLADRIERSQEEEIRLMTRWLTERGEVVPVFELYDPLAPPPDHHRHHEHPGPPDPEEGAAHDHSTMAGMLTDEQLDRLAASRGAEFERLFLEFMIYHHEGALIMVERLFSIPGAGQESDLFQFASHVDSDQRMEIARMLHLLRTLD